MWARGCGSTVITGCRVIADSSTGACRRMVIVRIASLKLLPREESWSDACETCEREVEFRQGPHAARKYQFVARGIAEALVTVGAGLTYRDAALVARERAKRLRVNPTNGVPRFSRHGSLVMDWVEVSAPVVFESYRPREWPATGSLLLDDLPFRVRDPETGRHRIAFRIFAAMGYVEGVRNYETTKL